MGQKIKGLKLGNKVKIYLSDNKTVTIKVDSESQLEPGYGLMKDEWNKIDPIKELEQMRQE